MAAVSPIPAHRARAEDGISLVEVLVVCAIGIVVLGAILQTLSSAERTVPRDVERTHAIADARAGLLRMVRELRGADVVLGTTPDSVDFETSADGSPRRVRFACGLADDLQGLRRCTRVTAPVGAELPAPAAGETLVVRVENGTLEDPVFRGDPDGVAPRSVALRVVVPSTGARTGRDRAGHDVVLEDGAYLRNRDLGG